MTKNIGLITLIITTFVCYGYSKTNHFDEVNIYYSVYENEHSNIYNSVNSEAIGTLPDSISLMVYTEKYNSLYSASSDSLFFLLDGVYYNSVFIGDVIQMKLTTDYLIIQSRLDPGTLTFTVFSLETNEIINTLDLVTTHFHDFMGQDNLFLSYVGFENNADIMRIEKYNLPSLTLDHSFQYSSLSWQHITMFPTENEEMTIYESFSHKIFYLSETGQILNDSVLQGPYEFIKQEQAFSSNELYMKTVDNENLYKVTSNRDDFSIERLENKGHDFLYNSGYYAEANLVDLNDTIFYWNPESAQAESIIEPNITAYCMEVRLITGLFNSIEENTSSSVLTMKSLEHKEIEDIMLFDLNGRILLKNTSKKGLSKTKLQPGYYILKGKENHNLVSYRLLIK